MCIRDSYDPATAPNSQNLPDIVAITYGICILERKTMLNNKNIIGNKPYFYRLDEIESIDIDTEYDFMVAQYVYKALEKM